MKRYPYKTIGLSWLVWNPVIQWSQNLIKERKLKYQNNWKYHSGKQLDFLYQSFQHYNSPDTHSSDNKRARYSLWVHCPQNTCANLNFIIEYCNSQLVRSGTIGCSPRGWSVSVSLYKVIIWFNSINIGGVVNFFVIISSKQRNEIWVEAI